ncbi:unnamed protein product [Rotaria sp. Silwood1]|nr:unnamed protein product [Rotaria sp. Silwood1]CAF0961387.1 unnamed protein product [Rotaria sp. Silwood1]CAF3347637.1 unnamed protein product [Rotaria sp. Silwood1]CAF3404337.1 unnamed protein product [Rotaria sp. Silwood1]CAF4600779.1 unnamed protein product [Rotaria sp. Silwood1]
MAVRSSLSPTFRTKTIRSDGNSLKNSTNYKSRVQSAPPLSLQQYARSSAIPLGTKPWQSPGVYHPPILHAYLSSEVRKQPERAELRKKLETTQMKPWIYAYKRKNSIPTYTPNEYQVKKPKPPEPVWHPPGKYVEQQPTSLSPERRVEKHIHEPAWRPPGRTQYKPVPYFDSPSLRWSLQDLKKSMAHLQTTTLRTSRSASVANN